MSYGQQIQMGRLMPSMNPRVQLEQPQDNGMMDIMSMGMELLKGAMDKPPSEVGDHPNIMRTANVIPMDNGGFGAVSATPEQIDPLINMLNQSFGVK